MRIIKTRLAALFAGLVLCLGAAQANAGLLAYDWSFVADTGTIKGAVFGLNDNATSSASQVLLLKTPGTTFFAPQETINAAATVLFNQWTVSDGALTFVDFLSADFDAGVSGDLLDIFGPLPGASAILVDGILDEAFSGSFSATPRSVPEPGTLGLLAFGIGALGLLRQRRGVS